METARSTAKELSFEELVLKFAEPVRTEIRKKARERKSTHVALMENTTFDSSQFGKKTALFLGGPADTWTIEDALDTPMFVLGDVPSRFQYLTAYAVCPQTQEDSFHG